MPIKCRERSSYPLLLVCWLMLAFSSLANAQSAFVTNDLHGTSGSAVSTFTPAIGGAWVSRTNSSNTTATALFDATSTGAYNGTAGTEAVYTSPAAYPTGASSVTLTATLHIKTLLQGQTLSLTFYASNGQYYSFSYYYDSTAASKWYFQRATTSGVTNVVSSATTIYTAGSTHTVTFSRSSAGAWSNTVDGASVLTIPTDTTFSFSSASSVGLEWNGGTNAGSSTTGSSLDSFSATSVGGALAAGSLTAASNVGSVVLSAASASGGTSPYTYNFYGSAVDNYTVGPGTLLQSGSSQTYTDSAVSPGVVKFYKLTVTDSATTPTTTLPAVQTAASGLYPSLVLGGLGDSIEKGSGGTSDPLTEMALRLAKDAGMRTITLVNRGLPSSATADWLPSSTTQVSTYPFTTGTVSTNVYNSAVAAWHAAGVNLVVCMLDTNDSNTVQNVPAATHKSQLKTILSTLLADSTNLPGVKIVLHNAPYVVPGSVSNGSGGFYYLESSNALLQAYQAVNAQIVTELSTSFPGRIFAGDSTAYAYFAQHPGEQSDGVHPSTVGQASLGAMWEVAYLKATSAGATIIKSVQPSRKLPKGRF